MQITLDIPEEFAAHIIPAGKDLAREALELLAIEGYRTRHLTESQVRRMLGYETRYQVHTLLAAHQVPLNYSLEHLEMDIHASDAMHMERLARGNNKESSH